jgi:hypothetical protein
MFSSHFVHAINKQQNSSFYFSSCTETFLPEELVLDGSNASRKVAAAGQVLVLTQRGKRSEKEEVEKGKKELQDLEKGVDFNYF